MKMLTIVGQGLIFFPPFNLSAISKFSIMTRNYLYNKYALNMFMIKL